MHCQITKEDCRRAAEEGAQAAREAAIESAALDLMREWPSPETLSDALHAVMPVIVRQWTTGQRDSAMQTVTAEIYKAMLNDAELQIEQQEGRRARL